MGGNAPDLVVQSNSIHDTFNRGIVNHAISHGNIIDNTMHNTLGHCFLNEDGVEEHNKIHHNLAHAARHVNWGCGHSHDKFFRCGSRSDDMPNGFWLPNMNQDMRNNVAVTRGIAFRHENRHVGGDTRLWFHPEAMKIGDRGKLKAGNSRLGKYLGNVAHSSTAGFFSYPHMDPMNANTAGYEGLVAYRCERGIFIKNTGLRGPLQVKQSRLILNHWGMWGQTPTTRVVISESHVLGSGGNARSTNQPFFLPVKILQNTFSDRAHCNAQLWPGSSFLRSALRFFDRKGTTRQIANAFSPDAYTSWWARCHGGYNVRTPNGNPSAALATIAHLREGLESCEFAPDKWFPPFVETPRWNMRSTTWREPEDVFDPASELDELMEELEALEEEAEDDDDDEYDDSDSDGEAEAARPDYSSYTREQLKLVLRRMRLKANGDRNTVLKRIYSALILIKKRAPKKLTPKDKAWLNAILY